MEKKNEGISVITAALVVCMIIGLVIVEVTTVEEEVPTEVKVEKELSRDEKIAQQFSTFDGRHFILARTIASQLKDPGSFQHVRTSYREAEGTLTVLMVYRAKNSFGALVRASVMATVRIDGAITGLTESPY